MLMMHKEEKVKLQIELDDPTDVEDSRIQNGVPNQHDVAFETYHVASRA
jgi:hypothetical protein